MTMRKKILWAGYGVLSLLTWFAYFGLWMLAFYYVILSVLAVICASLAIWILREYRFSFLPLVLVVLVFIAGQWWLIEFLVVQLIWNIKGFAP